jgi:SAM-dependent methyltransferase
MSANITATPVAEGATPSAHASYEAMAAVYDVFTAHHDYEAWTSMIESLARTHGLVERGRLLDIGCGTGKSFLPWLERGWGVVGCDSSPSMLRVAASKVPPRVVLEPGDARQLPAFGRFDLVLALDDVLNCIAGDELTSVFDGVARNLAREGLFVFDLNTIASYRTYFGETDVRVSDDCVVVWHGGAPATFSAGDFTDGVMDGLLREPAGSWARHVAVHRQHHHPLERVDAALRAAALELVAAYGQDEACNVDPEPDELVHSKFLAVARRAAAR